MMDTLKLDGAVNELTREHPVWVRRDTGDELVPVPSLLEQLAEAVQGSSGDGASRGNKQFLPIAADAFDLLHQIETLTRYHWQLTTRNRVVKDLPHMVREWAANARSREQYLATAEHITVDWVERIKALFDPPKRQTVKGSCPECGRRYVYSVDQGETVRNPALQVMVLEGELSYAECGGCLTRWDNGRLYLLAAVLEGQSA